MKVTSERWTELKCNVSGNPKPKLTWLRQDVPIGANNPKYLVLPSGSLRIFEVKPSDSGTYTCVASNPLGVARQPVELFVQGEKKNFLSLRWFVWRWPGNKSFFRWKNDKEAGKNSEGNKDNQPLTPIGDQDRISPYHFNAILIRQLMRIKKNIT